MDPALVLVGIMTFITGGGLVRYLRLSSITRNTDANSAVALAKAYTVLVEDLRKQISRNEDEIGELRKELRDLRSARESEIGGLRAELAIAYARVAALEQKVRELEDGRKEADG